MRESGRLAELSAQILIYLAQTPGMIEALSAESGLDPADLRAAVAESGFAQAALDFICATDERLLGFAAWAGRRPEDVARLRAALEAGVPVDRLDG